MGMIGVMECRSGRKILLDGNIYAVTNYEHHKPGKGRTVVRLKLKNLKTGSSLDKTFSHNDQVDEADIQTRNMQYLYDDGENCVFMDLASYEQYSITREILGDSIQYLKPETEAIVLLHGEEAIGVDLPPKLAFEVIDTIEAVRGNTATNVTKDATLETGVVVQVPLFIKLGEKIVIRMEDGTYVERA